MLVLFLLPGLSVLLHAQENCTESYGSGAQRFSLATGSPGELGLLKALAEEFNREKKTSLCWVKAGSGDSLKMLKEKEVDAIMVHAPAAEKQAVQQGWAIKRTLIGSNEFFIVGPPADPAGIASAQNVAQAYRKIAESKSPFLTRGDNSGTHKKELDIWKASGITPAGDWYILSKGFMLDTLKNADSLGGYFMTDSSTWIEVNKDIKHLKILFRGDPVMINTYHALCQPEGATAGQPAASLFVDFVASEKGQLLIRNFGKDRFGEGLYNDAEYAGHYDH
ncbi:MAG: substrate-binding domain-containing protein [Deltaproteobacteria bacterium]|nr:substrate-binding domain-containing protein [Deltaproteobacteria bacterium]